jgi:hypothetical protein
MIPPTLLGREMKRKMGKGQQLTDSKGREASNSDRRRQGCRCRAYLDLSVRQGAHTTIYTYEEEQYELT